MKALLFYLIVHFLFVTSITSNEFPSSLLKKKISNFLVSLSIESKINDHFQQDSDSNTSTLTYLKQIYTKTSSQVSSKYPEVLSYIKLYIRPRSPPL